MVQKWTFSYITEFGPIEYKTCLPGALGKRLLLFSVEIILKLALFIPGCETRNPSCISISNYLIIKKRNQSQNDANTLKTLMKRKKEATSLEIM